MAMTLKAARVNAGLTQKEAAKALGVSQLTLIKWERGETSPRVVQGEKLCELYGLSWEDIKFCPSCKI